MYCAKHYGVKAGGVRLLSEDLTAGQTIAGVPIENPFGPLR